MSVIRNNAAGEGFPPPRLSRLSAVYEFLSSVRLTILTLFFIAAACIVGTLVPQQAPVQEYLSHYSESTYAIFRMFGLTNVFRSSWFFFLTVVFVVNLLLCSVGRFGRFLKNRDENRFPDEKRLRAMSASFFLKGRKVGDAAVLFRGFRQVGLNDRGVILDKGSISRYGIHVVHGSIIVILIGSLVGIAFGYRGFVTLRGGETKEAIVSRDAAGTTISLPFGIKLDDFQVSFYPDGAPKEYVSTLEILDQGRSVEKAAVRVNHPLSYGGTSIYQASYGSDPIFLFDINGKKVRLHQGATYRDGAVSVMAVRFEPSIHNFGPGVQIAYLEGNTTQTAWLVKAIPDMRQKVIAGCVVRLDDIVNEFYTGLEVSHDPGVWIVWTGFAAILFGLYVNFFLYYRRVYLLQTPEGVLVAGTCPRHKEAFQEEFEKWRKKANDVE